MKMDKKILVPGVAIISLLSTISAVWAQDFIGSLNEGLNQAGAFVVAICFLVGIVVFIATYLTTKLNKPGWRNVFIIMGLLLIGLVLANAFTGGAIALYFPGIFGLIIGGIMGVLFIMEMFVAAEYLGKREIWRSPEKAREALEKAESVEDTREGAPSAAKVIAEEESIDEAILRELRELVKEYKGAAATMTYQTQIEERKVIIETAEKIIRVLELQDESLSMKVAIDENSHLAGEEAIKDPQVTTELNSALIALCQRKMAIDKTSFELVEELVKIDEAELDKRGIATAGKYSEGGTEKKAINEMYALHKKSLGILRKLQNQLLTKEKMDASERNLSAIVENATKRMKSRQLRAEGQVNSQEVAEVRQELGKKGQGSTDA